MMNPKLLLSLLCGVLFMGGIWFLTHLSDPEAPLPIGDEKGNNTVERASSPDWPTGNKAPMPGSSKQLLSEAGPASLQAIRLPVGSGRFDAEGFEIVDWPAGKPHYEGEPVVAKVTTGKSGRKLHLEVNQMGEYPRVQVDAGEAVNVRMQFQRSPAEMPLALTAQDGGGLAGSKPSQSVRLASDRSATFEFTAGQNDGVHRVTVATPAGEVKTFDFWVGPLNIMRTTAQR